MGSDGIHVAVLNKAFSQHKVKAFSKLFCVVYIYVEQKLTSSIKIDDTREILLLMTNLLDVACHHCQQPAENKVIPVTTITLSPSKSQHNIMYALTLSGLGFPPSVVFPCEAGFLLPLTHWLKVSSHPLLCV